MHDIQLELHSVHGAVALFDERERAIYSRRLIAKNPQTLDQIGQDFGVTRERIRQIEASVIKTLRKSGGDEILKLANIPNQERWVLHHSQLGDDLSREFFKPGVGSALEVLRALGLVESWDGPWVTGGMKKIFRKVRGPYLDFFITEVNRKGPTIAEFTAQMKELGLDQEFVSEWIDSIGLQISGNRVRGANLTGVEFVQDLLEVAGKPLDWNSEIAPHLASKWNPRGILGRIQEEDQRFTRTDVDSYGLAEWGFPAYEGISREIEKLIEQHGPTKVNLIVAILTARFSIAEDSVRAYAKQGNLVVKDGVVHFAEPKSEVAIAPKIAQMNERQMAGLTIFEDKFEYRIAVNHDRLRGSGGPVSSGLMAVIGLARGFSTVIQVNNPVGFSLTFSWARGGQPLLGSIRLLLNELGAKEGDTAVLVFHGSEGNINKIDFTIE